MNERGGKEKVIINLDAQNHKVSRDFKILIYESLADYVDARCVLQKDASIPKYDITLVWVSEIKCYDSSNSYT